MDNSTVIPLNLMRDAVHFNPVTLPLTRRYDMESISAHPEPMFKAIELFQMSQDSAPIHVDPIFLRPQTIDHWRIRLPLIPQVDTTANLLSNLGPAPRR